MAHLNSNNVVVFPVAKERISDLQETRLLTEYNVSNLIRQLLGKDSDGFIISSTYTDDSGWEIEFNLHGYYFKVNGITTDWLKDNFPTEPVGGINYGTGLYAAISIDYVDEIYGQDKENLYEGIYLLNTPPEISLSETIKSVHYIKLLDVTNVSGEDTFISIQNKHHFATALIGGIDGKYK